MRFNFLVLIHLAVVTTIGSSILALNSYLRHPLSEGCSNFVEKTVASFGDCQFSVRKPVIEYGEDALPYVCLISLDVAVELCKLPERLKKLDGPNNSEPVCPMAYALKSTNLKINITAGLEYMRKEINCRTVCDFYPNLSHACQFIAIANKIINEEEVVGESPDLANGEKKQLQDFVTNDKTSSSDLVGKISQDMNIAQDTKNLALPESLNGKGVQTVTVDKSDITRPVTKIDSDSVNIKTSAGDLDLRTKSENKRPVSSSENSKNKKIISGTNSLSKTFNQTVLLKNDTLKNKDTYNKKPSELNKSQIFLSNEDTDIPETEPSPSLNNYYNLKKNQNSVNNNSSIDYGDDSVLKTPQDVGEDDDDNNDEDMEKSALQDALPDREPQFAKSLNTKEIYSSDNFFQAEDSHFSVYFLTTVSIIIIGYVIYHNKKKILAYALEGRRNKNGRRRPTSASYRKLDCNLEEAIASNPSNTSVTNVVY